MLPNRKEGKSARATPPEVAQPEAKPSDGGFQAMDQVANWVRFADTKATILTAGLGVVMTMLMANADTITNAIKRGCPAIYIVGPLAGVTLIAFGYTLLWLVRAIGPQSGVSYSSLNRFAWPTLREATPEQLTDHVRRVDVQADAWQQVIDLSRIAHRKFDACGRAVRGFALLVLLAVTVVASAVGFTSWG